MGFFLKKCDLIGIYVFFVTLWDLYGIYTGFACDLYVISIRCICGFIWDFFS